MKTRVPTFLHSKNLLLPNSLPLGLEQRLAGCVALSLVLAGLAQASMVVTPADGLSATGYIGGPFSPPSQIYTLANSGLDPLTWSAGKNQPWVSVSPSSGTLAAGQSTNVTAFVNAVPLDYSTGAYSAVITFIDVSAGESTTRNAALSIGQGADATVSFATQAASNQIQIQFTGQAGSSYDLQSSTNVIGPWASIRTGTFASSVVSHTVNLDKPRQFYRVTSSGAGAIQSRMSWDPVLGLNLLEVIVSGSSYGTYVLEASSDGGASWQPVSTNKAPASGTYSYVGTGTNLQYRAKAMASINKPVVDHVLIVGESIAIGMDGAPALSTSASGGNLRFYTDSSSTNLAPLYELAVETIASAAANHVVANAPSRRVMVSNIGSAGADYAFQKKGTALYNSGMQRIEKAPQALADVLLSYRPRAVFALEGNGDILAPDYDLFVREWQSDYQKDIQRVTGYSDPISMFHCQVSAWTSPTVGSHSTAVSPYELLAEAEAYPTKTILVCPSYFFPYVSTGTPYPGLHLSNLGNRWLGEYFAKAYKRVVVEGAEWTPLKPNSITRSGAVITATFDVPAPPLVMDTTLVSDPGNYGFEYTDDSGSPPAITQVQVTGAATVQVTLSAVPTGANQRLRYAYTGIPGNSGGPTTGPRGNLRDSDSEVSLYGNTLYNWCVHFDKPVN